MNKKKNTFSLIEVLVAIILTTTACIFFLQFEQGYIKKARDSLIRVQQERLMQEACVRVLENLYTNQIDWKSVQEKKPASFTLSEPDWKVRADFTPINVDEKIVQTLMHVEVKLTLYHQDIAQSESPTMRLCLKKEDRSHVQAPT